MASKLWGFVTQLKSFLYLIKLFFFVFESIFARASSTSLSLNSKFDHDIKVTHNSRWMEIIWILFDNVSSSRDKNRLQKVSSSTEIFISIYMTGKRLISLKWPISHMKLTTAGCDINELTKTSSISVTKENICFFSFLTSLKWVHKKSGQTRFSWISRKYKIRWYWAASRNPQVMSHSRERKLNRRNFCICLEFCVLLCCERFNTPVMVVAYRGF